MPGFVPQLTCGASSPTSSSTTRSYAASGSDGSSRQRSSARSHSTPCGAAGRPSRKAKVVSSGAIIPARAPASMDMLQMVIRPDISRPRITSPAYSTTWPDASRDADPADGAEDDVLGGHAERERAREVEEHRLRPPLGQGLRGQHVLDLRGADAEGERSDGTVGRRVAVAADDRHPGLREAQLGPDHVHDALRARCRSRRAGRRTPRSYGGAPRAARRRGRPPAGRPWGRCDPSSRA